MLRNGTNQTISTKHMCITAMKQYESKSLEVSALLDDKRLHFCNDSLILFVCRELLYGFLNLCTT